MSNYSSDLYSQSASRDSVTGSFQIDLTRHIGPVTVDAILQFVDETKHEGRIDGLYFLAPLVGYTLDNEKLNGGERLPELSEAYADCVMPQVVRDLSIDTMAAIRLLGSLTSLKESSKLIHHLLSATVVAHDIEHPDSASVGANYVYVVKSILCLYSTSNAAALRALSGVTDYYHDDPLGIDANTIRALEKLVNRDLDSARELKDKRHTQFNSADGPKNTVDWIDSALGELMLQVQSTNSRSLKLLS